MDYTLILIAVALAVFVFFQFRTSRKRAKDTAARQKAIVPGVEIMTNFGLYGTVVSIDEDTNLAIIETESGALLKIHRQTILKTVEEDVAIEDAADSAETTSTDATAELNNDNASAVGEPEFGERVEPTEIKPERKTAKKSDD